MSSKKKRRQCGTCHVCCDLLSVEAIGKEALQRCVHQANKGCKVFSSPERPASCSAFACAWLEDARGEFFHDLLRPDRCHVMVRGLPADSEGMVVHEARPGALLTDKGKIILALGEFILDSEPGSRVEVVFADGTFKTWLPGVEWTTLFQEAPVSEDPLNPNLPPEEPSTASDEAASLAGKAEPD